MDDSESMDKINILERIIAEEGSCNWASSSICANCPLSRLVQYESGRLASCVEALKVDGLSEEEADAKYKLAATEKLAELIMDRIIEEE
jgi:hypothetical protein